jgi:hypothetical protein
MKVSIAAFLAVSTLCTPATAQVGGAHKQTGFIGGPVATPNRVGPPHRGSPPPLSATNNPPSITKKR